MASPAASGVIMQVSPCQPRSLIFATPKAIPALILSASKPGGREGSEKSTVSGFWPTKRIRVIGFLHSSDGGIGRRGASLTGRHEGGSAPSHRPNGSDLVCARPVGIGIMVYDYATATPYCPA